MGVGLEVVGGEAPGLGGRGNDVRATVCGVGRERGVARLGDSGGVDGPPRDRETCGAWRMAAAALPGTNGGAAAVFCNRLSGARLICARALSAQRAVGLASGVT